MYKNRLSAVLAFCIAIGTTFTACSNGDVNADAATGPVGGPVMGPQDSHCQEAGGLTIQVTDQNACHATVDMAGDMPDGGTEDEPDYGETMFNSRGYDDDCKYLVNFYSTPIRRGQAVTLYATAINATNRSAVRGANIRAEIFLSDTHPAPNSNTQTTEQGEVGSYVIGPVLFDASGRWTVRFHLYEDCSDALPESPHGHAAFFVDVP